MFSCLYGHRYVKFAFLVRLLFVVYDIADEDLYMQWSFFTSNPLQ
jgi:hypothetical protein